jgi:ATP-dependent protease ClpP protease subunit
VHGGGFDIDLSCIMQTYSKVVFIKEAITEEVANQNIALSLYLDSLDEKRVYYWLNCPGGEVRISTGSYQFGCLLIFVFG